MKRWYVLYTKPHKERHVCLYLKAKGVETYLPLVVIERGKKYVEVPFFSCYLFVHLDLMEPGALSVQWTPGLRRWVSFDGRPASVGDEFIETLQVRLGEDEELLEVRQGGFRHGEQVRVTEGPFQGFEGMFDKKLAGEERVRILLDFLGRTTAVEIDSQDLTKA